MKRVIVLCFLATLCSAQKKHAHNAELMFSPAFAKAAIRAVVEMDSTDRQYGPQTMETNLGNRAVEERLHDAEAEVETEADKHGMVLLRKGQQFFTSCSIVWTVADSVKVERLKSRCKQDLLTAFKSNKPDADTSHCGLMSEVWNKEQ
jgi:hypothetical protein